MKRFLIGISIFLVSLLSFAVPVRADDASLSISGGGAKKIGTTFNLTASLNSGGNQICVVTFDITYPANLLTLKSSSLGTPFTMATEQSSTDGNIHYSVGAGGCTTGNATLLTMSFTAKAAGNATVAFSSGEAIGGADGQQVIATGKGSTAVTMAAATVTNKNTNTAPAPAAAALKDPVLSKLVYSADSVLDNITNQAKGITFTGTSDADAKIDLVITSDPINASAQADASGNWAYTLVDWLPAGSHVIAMTAEKGTQKSAEVKTSFVIGTGGKDQIAIGTELPATTAVAEPASNTKSKMSFTTIAMIGSGVVVVLVVVLLIIFMNKRRKYLSVAKEISSRAQPSMASPKQANLETGMVGSMNMPQQSQIPNSEEFLSPAGTAAGTTIPNQASATNNQPMNMPENIIAQEEPKMPANAMPAPESNTVAGENNMTASPRPLSTQIQNVKPDSGEMVIGYAEDSNPVSQSEPKVAPEAPVTPPAPPTQTASPKKDSDESEITFDS